MRIASEGGHRSVPAVIAGNHTDQCNETILLALLGAGPRLSR
jgi:hypothetical protein